MPHCGDFALEYAHVPDHRPEGRFRLWPLDPAAAAWRLHVSAKAHPLIDKLQAVGADLVEHAFAGIDRKDIELTRQVLARIRDNAGRTGPITKASNQ